MQAITMYFVLDSPKKWIKTAFTESVSTRSLPWLAENTFADRTDQMFIRLINKVYNNDTHRVSVQNRQSSNSAFECLISYALQHQKGFFFTFMVIFRANALFPTYDWSGLSTRVTRAVTPNWTSFRIQTSRSMIKVC